MKRLFALFLVSLGIFLGSVAHAEEMIKSFDVQIHIQPDSTVLVEEKIQYDFGDASKHGIFRTIPVVYPGKFSGFVSAPITNVSVRDEKNNAYTYTVSRSGSDVTIKVGDADKTVTGRKVYILSYTVDRSIGYFSDHDELYWNVTGNAWPVPIQSVYATVFFPKSFATSDVKASCFVGYSGSTVSCEQKNLVSNSDGTVSGATFSVDSLNPEEGLTFVVGWPVGVVFKPTTPQLLWLALLDNKIVLIPVLVFITLVSLWRTRGRDPEGRGVIIPQYDAPDKLTPVEVGTVLDEIVGTKNISTEIIYLATRGYLKINRIETGSILKTVDYELEQLKDSSSLTEVFDVQIWNMLFSSNTRIKLSDLENNVSEKIARITLLVCEVLVTKGYFSSNPEKTRSNYIAGSIWFGVIFFLIALFFNVSGVFAFASAAVSSIIIFIFAFIMPSRTKKGVEAKEYILGLKLYLTVAEEARINFHNAPEKNPQQFEKYLPYAMALGVEKQWAKQFESLQMENPSWYNDSVHQDAFNAALFANEINHFSSSVNSTFSETRASSGGSGFSGGDSGGGFGGGGGGSW
jgi:uncharacterized membrane protein